MKNTTKDLKDRMSELKKDMKEKLEEALDNPLNDMK